MMLRERDVAFLAGFLLVATMITGISGCKSVPQGARSGDPRYHGKEFVEYYFFDDRVADTILDEDGSMYGPADENGIKLADWGGFKELYHPTSIAATCINYFGGYVITGKEIFKEIVLRHADWLVENQVITHEGFGVWNFTFPNRAFGAEAPWISAMTQGRAISGLLRAHQLSGQAEFLDAARLAVEAFDYSIQEGGVSYIDPDGFVWYEEVAVSPPAHILNGFIFALFGLYDYYRVTQDEHALELFNAGLDTLRSKLHLYDTGGVTRYDLLLRGQLLRLVVPGRQPKSKHPVEKVVLTTDGAMSVLDVGAEGDSDSTDIIGSLIYAETDWSSPYVVDGRTVRDYLDNPDARYEHGALRLKLPEGVRWAAEDLPIRVEIFYKDTTAEEIHLEIYDGERYHRIGTIGGDNDGQWKSEGFIFPSEWLHFGGGLAEGYHGIVVRQLKGLYNVTADQFFLAMSEKWDNQVE